ncbi:hypothetical protein GCM10027270_35270 [Nocardioides ginkgobilobae]
MVATNFDTHESPDAAVNHGDVQVPANAEKLHHGHTRDRAESAGQPGAGPPHTTADATADLSFLAEVLRKVWQRGTNPVVPSCDLPPGLETQSLSEGHLLAATAGPMRRRSPAVDPSIQLHDTYEKPLWDLVASHFPRLHRFLHPQASLEALTESSTGERWVDFLLAAPWTQRAVVIELDGQQHGMARAVDAQRDRALAHAGIMVSRHPGPSVFDAGSPLAEALRWTHDLATEADPEVVQFLHEPATTTRLGIALVDLMCAGALPPGAPWRLELVDETGWAHRALPHVLKLMRAVAALWNLEHLMPTSVHSVGPSQASDTIDEPRAPSPGQAPPSANARICLEPFTPTWANLTPTDLPTVVIRSTYLPVDLAWQQQREVGRRYVDPGRSDVDAALREVLAAVFGFEQFRDGQAQAIRTALAGQDSCVLLPTGAGKSLIYQLAGLLHPGVTLVIDPLISLVDDQERRLVADGVDRVIGLTGARQNTGEAREAAYNAVSSGDALVVFLTPERLQIQAFRDALGAAAASRRINLCVIDEAHCVSEWGHDFRTAYLRVGRNLRHLCSSDDDIPPPLLALTGTASPAVLRDVLIELQQANRDMTVLRPSSFDRANLTYEVLLATEQTWPSRLREALTEVLPERLGCTPAELFSLAGPRTRSGIVFVPHVNGEFGLDKTRAKVVAAIRSLEHGQLDVAVGTYAGSAPRSWTGGRRGWEREKTLQAERFKDDQSSILVSTKAFGMGIDKPNIRWTMHLGHPASIEGFAQEAGRAGRDNRPAHCVLVAVPPGGSVAAELLDLNAPRATRVAAYQALPKNAGGDLARQYFFLTNNYDGIDEEFYPALEVLDSLLPAGPTNRIAIPMADGPVQSSASKIEKALFRLAMIGVVDDYTVDYGASRYVVDLSNYSVEHLDEQVRAFVSRVEPSRSGLRNQQLTRAPEDIRDRAAHHLRMLLEILYAVIEPARVRALAEMHLFVTSGDDSEGLRQRILAYLSDGPLAGILTEVATADSLNPYEITRLLDTVPAEEPREWIGSSARLLESYPDHPALLLVRAIGEALLPDPDQEVVATTLLAAFQHLAAYDVNETGTSWTLRWTCAQLRNQQGGRGWPLLPLVYDAWRAAGQDETAVISLEDDVLQQATRGVMHPTELRYVLNQRLRRLSNTLDSELQTLTGR